MALCLVVEDHEPQRRTTSATLRHAGYQIVECGRASDAIELCRLHRPEITTLAARVRLHVDPTLDARFPAEAGARVCVETAAGHLERTVRHPLGDPANPMDRMQLTTKFRRLAAGVMAPADQDRLLSAVENLPDLESVEPVLARPPTSTR